MINASVNNFTTVVISKLASQYILPFLIRSDYLCHIHSFLLWALVAWNTVLEDQLDWSKILLKLFMEVDMFKSEKSCRDFCAICVIHMYVLQNLLCSTSTCPSQLVGWLVHQSPFLDFHCVVVSGPSQSLFGPRNVICFLKAMSFCYLFSTQFYNIFVQLCFSIFPLNLLSIFLSNCCPTFFQLGRKTILTLVWGRSLLGPNPLDQKLTLLKGAFKFFFGKSWDFVPTRGGAV